MAELDTFLTIPIGTLAMYSQEKGAKLLEVVSTLPPNTLALISAPKTGAYIRGLAKTYNLSAEAARTIARAVFEVALGHISVGGLQQTLAQRLSVSASVAQTIGHDIERELFAPIILELNRIPKKPLLESSPQPTMKTVSRPTDPTGLRNVLDLKNQPKPPVPPPIPR